MLISRVRPTPLIHLPVTLHALNMNLHNRRLQQCQLTIMFINSRRSFLFRVSQRMVSQERQRILHSSRLLNRTSPDVVTHRLNSKLIRTLLRRMLMTRRTVRSMAFPIRLRQFTVATIVLRRTVHTSIIRRTTSHHRVLISRTFQRATANSTIQQRINLFDYPNKVIGHITTTLTRLVNRRHILVTNRLANSNHRSGTVHIRRIVNNLKKNSFLIRLIGLIRYKSVANRATRYDRHSAPVASRGHGIRFRESTVFQPSSWATASVILHGPNISHQ